MIKISQFTNVENRPSKRITKCKNCWDWPGEVPVSIILPNQPRIVISGGFGPGTRNLTLCLSCAMKEMSDIQALNKQLKKAISCK